MSGVSDKVSELPTPPKHDHTLVSHCPTPYPQKQSDEECRNRQEQTYEIPQDRVICSSSHSPGLSHYPRVPTRIVGEVTFDT